jgi:hypothetical protein
MHAFDFILVLFSFVYAAAVTQLLWTAGEIMQFCDSRMHVHGALNSPRGAH